MKDAFLYPSYLTVMDGDYTTRIRFNAEKVEYYLTVTDFHGNEELISTHKTLKSAVLDVRDNMNADIANGRYDNKVVPASEDKPLVPKIDYAKVSLLNICQNTENQQIVSVVYSGEPMQVLYFIVRPENYDKKFGSDTIISHWDTDFSYDDEGASDEASKKELDELLSWCDYDSMVEHV